MKMKKEELKRKVLEGKRKMLLEQNGEYYTDKEIMEEYKHIFQNIQNRKKEIQDMKKEIQDLEKEYEFLVFHGYIEE